MATLHAYSPMMIATAIANSSYGVMVRTVWRLAGDRRREIVLVNICLGFAGLFALSQPILIGHIVEAVTRGEPDLIPRVLRTIGLLMLNVLAFWAFNGPGRCLERRIAFQVRINMTDKLYANVTSMPWAWHQDHHSGGTLSRINAATEATYKFADDHFLWFEAITRLFGSLAVMLWFAPTAGLAYLLFIPPVLWVMRRFNMRLRLASREQNILEQQLSAGLVDYLGNIATVLTLRLESVSRREIMRRIALIWQPFRRQLLLVEMKWFVFVTSMEFTGLMAILFYVLWNRSSPPAELAGSTAAIFQYVRLITQCVRNIVDRQQGLIAQRVSVDAVEDILDSSIARAAADTAQAAWQNALVRQVSYRYPGQPDAPSVLEDVVLALARGRRIALVGESGSGKSTLLRILRGLHQPDDGLLDMDDRQTPFTALSHITTLVPQEPEIFENTLRYNITCGIADEAGLDEIVLMACVGPVLELLPNGLDTDIRERGVNLSGGQKQRLALARGLFAARDSSILLLDEPTSSLDAVTEAIVYDRIFAGLPDTCIISSVHRLHLLSRFDHIYVMDRGRIVEQGSLAELVVRSGPLSRMWAAQQQESSEGEEGG